MQNKHDKRTKKDKLVKHKTIASIVTPLGEGGIGKIMVSGPNAFTIVNKIFAGKGIADLQNAVNQKLYYGYIHDKGQRLDEVILHIIRKEDSFTGEDIVEINCHGGIRVVMRIYECLQSSGAKGVPWEALLQQSFENNKMDFVQKEAFQTIVQAHTKLGVKVLLDQHAGALSSALRQGLEIIEGIERAFHKESWYHGAVIHTDQHEGEEKSLILNLAREGREALLDEQEILSSLENHIRCLLETASLGTALTTPQVLVILGKPNVGKSTLINAILGEERMLVHHEPGTTRDYVSELISVYGVPFEIVDTAGIRDTEDTLESMGIEMALEQLQRADKVMAVFDNSKPFDQEDAEILSALSSWSMKKSSDDLHQNVNTYKIVPVINKCDLTVRLDRKKIESAVTQPLCSISARNREGLEDVKERLVGELGTTYKPMRPIVFTRRQYCLLVKADVVVKQVKSYLSTGDKTCMISGLIDELKKIFTACLEGHRYD
ncbi:MAG: GTPase and tRNA-U34 5-formylation enzyme TrmE [Candidatus Jettenia ecosi]|uniref:GTPase and tRNA-U34 5-formylation enzyme TrmE n=1 Tax=Candidatus Jettenia ecosi TaxID=2494326 RepID=A0A533Q5K6_9BACT|nr:MAG: GTPase and tRNA-U34 5-formylation enzyme TrmE [Candidatus Jettenia ecosi]